MKLFPSPFDRDILFQKRETIMGAPVVATDSTMGAERDKSFLTWALSHPAINPQFQRPDSDLDYSNPATIHMGVSTRLPVTHPGTGTEPWRVELARFDCPMGTTGIVRSLEQYVRSVDAQASSTTWTANQYWGDPHCVSGVWSLRIEPMRVPAPQWVSMLTISIPLPGIRYTDWEPSEGVWYPAGSQSANSIHLVIPAGNRLRVFWDWPGGEEKPTVACTLRGSLHNQYSAESRLPIRSIW